MAKPEKIPPATFQFLKALAKNNNRDWFNANKEVYQSANENFILFTQSLIDEISNFDHSLQGLDARKSVFRIYRDMRFSKDKTPYKTSFSATLLGKGKGCGLAGYYLKIEPGASMLAGGVHMTEPADLKAIRNEISSQGEDFLKIIRGKSFKTNFNLVGEKLSRVPQAFDKDDPMGEYLRHKELMIHHGIADAQVTANDFQKYCAKICKAMVPFNRFINESVSK